jgi:hypothetical protein
MAGNIIPAIATTNAMTAGLCVLQALKVLKDDYAHAKMVSYLPLYVLAYYLLNCTKQVFLERSGARALNSDSLKPPNPNCPVCSVAQGRVKIDPERATINDLVQDILRLQLGYGEELSLSNELGTIYDPDLEDNLPKKLSELGVINESLITVIDEEDNQPRVNLELVILTEKYAYRDTCCILKTCWDKLLISHQTGSLDRRPEAHHSRESTPDSPETKGTDSCRGRAGQWHFRSKQSKARRRGSGSQQRRRPCKANRQCICCQRRWIESHRIR